MKLDHEFTSLTLLISDWQWKLDLIELLLGAHYYQTIAIKWTLVGRSMHDPSSTVSFAFGSHTWELNFHIK